MGEKTYVHKGLEPIEFVRFFGLDVPKSNVRLDIKLSHEELTQAQHDMNNLLSENGISEKSKVIGFFRNARFDKKIEDAYWKKWIDEVHAIDPAVVFIDILSPDIPEKLSEKVLAYQSKNLRVLGAFFQKCDLFVCGDTGPMHLAVASQAKVLALFKATKVELFGALGEKNYNIDINEVSIKDIARLTCDNLS